MSKLIVTCYYRTGVLVLPSPLHGTINYLETRTFPDVTLDDVEKSDVLRALIEQHIITATHQHDTLPTDLEVASLADTGGGGGVTGAPNSLVYINPLGTAGVTNPKLVAAPIDQFGRPQIRDTREAAGLGSVFRQGAWESDGDPAPNQQGEGIVIYGKGIGGNMNTGEGAYARIKSYRLGLAVITPGVASSSLYYLGVIDYSGITTRPDTLGPGIPDPSFFVDRLTGNLMVTGSVRVGGPAGARTLAGFGDPNGAVVGSVGDLYQRLDGGVGTSLYTKASGSATNSGWVSAALPLSGNPNSLVFDDGAGAQTTHPDLIIRPVGSYGRPEIWDRRTNPGPSNTWAVFRQGAWSVDGDPVNAKASGFVTYGSAANNLGPNDGQGGMGFYTSHSWGTLYSQPGGPAAGTFYGIGSEDGTDDSPGFWPFKNASNPAFPCNPGLATCDNSGVVTGYLERLTGKLMVSSVRLGLAGPSIITGVGGPNGAVVGSPGDMYLNSSGGANTTLYVKESGNATNTGWIGK